MKFRKLALLITLIVSIAMFASMSLFAAGTIESDGTSVMENQGNQVTLATLRGESSDTNEMAQNSEDLSTVDGIILFIPRSRNNVEALNNRNNRNVGEGYGVIENNNQTPSASNQLNRESPNRGRVMNNVDNSDINNSMESSRRRLSNNDMNQSDRVSVNNRRNGSQRIKNTQMSNKSDMKSSDRNNRFSSHKMISNKSFKSKVGRSVNGVQNSNMNNRTGMQKNSNARMMDLRENYLKENKISSDTISSSYMNRAGLGRNANMTGICYYSENIEVSK